MITSVQNLLKKINFIEAEVEIQKQILFSIPSDNEKEVEKVIKKIAHAKKEIEKLRAEIKAQSPDEYQKILKIEEAVTAFKDFATEKKFTSIDNMSNETHCSIILTGGEKLPCLVKAKDEAGNWTVITLEGDIRHFNPSEVDN